MRKDIEPVGNSDKLNLPGVIVCIFISFIVQSVWSGLELLIYGETQSRIVDDVISIILTGSLYFNYLQWKGE
ncbi:MAG: hypothetical protein E7558_08685 [Ruminococcaceae bacterium]|nr:hypothetical protein [Oscillospiraceae bacterium]